MLTQLNCVYIFKSKLHYRPSNLSGSFNLVPKLSTHQSRSLKCVKWSSEIPNAPCKKPKLTWHATWHHGGKYWQKNLYSLISLTLSNLSHPLPSLSLSPISLALSTLSHSLPLLSPSLSLPHPLQSLSHSPFTLSLSLPYLSTMGACSATTSCWPLCSSPPSPSTESKAQLTLSMSHLDHGGR